MTLAAGVRLGPYEILSALGAGGMGEVYRARDATLNRDVALKVLPELFALDLDRLARFKREAQVLASLNHPNIAHVYGLEDSHGVRALVMELVEGPTLADLIGGAGAEPRALPIEETLPIARQIAFALEAAHEQGIVHRDLKPANIKVRPDGTVKVLDFGLAKAIDPPAGTQAAALANSPTLTSPTMMTGVGVILGTAAYMSPEQAKGRGADKRSDVWAFGCVFYEMLAGRRAFCGEDVSDTLAAVLRGEPDWNALPADVPPAVRALIQGCLLKDRKERVGDISTALFLLNQPLAASQSAQVAPRSAWRLATLVFAGVLIGAVTAASMLWNRGVSPAAGVTRFAVTPPQGKQLTLNRQSVALSPDGTRIVYAADGGLFLRSLSDLEAKPIPGTESGESPVFSPDGQSLVFWADSALKRIAVSGGTALIICRVVSSPPYITWPNDDDVLFSQGQSSVILRVSSNGGKPETFLDLNDAEQQAWGPQLLPGGAALLLTVAKRSGGADRFDEAQIVVQSLKTGMRKPIIDGGNGAQYIPTGHIVYASGGTLFAVPFDLAKLQVTGRAVPVVDGVRQANFAFANTGTLVYEPGPASGSARQPEGGVEARLTTPETGTSHIPESWSPNGEVLLFSATKDSVSSLWAFTPKDQRATLFGDVTGSSLPTDAMFSPDGHWVAYQVGKPGVTEGTTYVQPFPPTGKKYQLPMGGGRPLWSRDGKELFFIPSPTQFMTVTVTTAPSFALTRPIAVSRGFGAAAPGFPRTFDIMPMPDGRIIGVGTAGQRQSAPGPAQIHVVLNWFEDLKARAPAK